MNNLKALLDEYVANINVPEFINSDPVKFPRRYTSLRDVEIAGLLSAINAWGRRDIILNDMERLFAFMGNSPEDFVMSSDFSFGQYGSKAVHRTFNYCDLEFICRGLRNFYLRHDSLEDCFVGRDMFDGIKVLRRHLIEGNGAEGHLDHAVKHLSNPDSKSACKRLHLFLRWMVRRDGIVDLGLWTRLSPKHLYIPLDVHSGRVARSLGMIDRMSNDRTTVEQLSDILSMFDPEDPIRYDFGLFGIGVNKILDF
ncbi:MAG: TIGR02757 family protein [Prevotellaceae bacterium]|nr:TIGR02757 family protein [Prevotellaceae bacterium]